MSMHGIEEISRRCGEREGQLLELSPYLAEKMCAHSSRGREGSRRLITKERGRARLLCTGKLIKKE